MPQTEKNSGLTEEEENTLAMLERELLMMDDHDDEDGEEKGDICEKDFRDERPQSRKDPTKTFVSGWVEKEEILSQNKCSEVSQAFHHTTGEEKEHSMSNSGSEDVLKRQASKSPTRSGIPTFQRSSSGSGRQSSPVRSRLPVVTQENRVMNGISLDLSKAGEGVLKGGDFVEKNDNDLAWEVNISEISGRAKRSKKRKGGAYKLEIVCLKTCTCILTFFHMFLSFL